MSKINLALFFGGNSIEHEVSLKTAYSIAKELEKSDIYNIIYIGILKNNKMIFNENIDKIKDDATFDSKQKNEPTTNTILQNKNRTNKQYLHSLKLLRRL